MSKTLFRLPFIFHFYTNYTRSTPSTSFTTSRGEEKGSREKRGKSDMREGNASAGASARPPERSSRDPAVRVGILASLEDTAAEVRR
ncbi:hypothetical protein AKJ64_04080 [candidate division MSBL1 archaeon SCGC-AAA259E17]|uniref:Uncharacterized protein n=1 Tax=candidate division MSBL1 archaeon SCGC-AAA259E17 TaxID=1698263 RepID=A0A133UD25_9EURY|nr:hypothetical protein AKJ64_04080 [candidate division MSBL1 archaeon SCGC-AAA259E17]